MRMNIAIERLNSFKLWWAFFFYTFFASALVQLVLLPYVFPGLHAGNGLLNSSFDSIGFHQLAADLADKIRIHGWSAWQLRPGGQSPAGIASIFYFFILPDPRILIPLSAVLHASAALALVNILNLFVKNKAKAIICALPFLVFPSNLQWTAQWHRDGFCILGIVLVLQGMVLSARSENYKVESWFFISIRSIIFYFCGFILIWIVRPYVLSIIDPFVKLLFSLLFLSFLVRTFKKEISWQKTLLVSLSMLLIIFALERTKMDICSAEFKENASVLDNEEEMVEYEIKEISEPSVAAKPITEKPFVKEETPVAAAKEEARSISSVSEPSVAAKPITEKPFVKEETPVAAAREEKTVFISPSQTQEISKPKTKKIKVKVKKSIKKDYIENHWKRSFWLPLFIENKAYSLAQIRRGFRSFAPEAKSNIDRNVGFGSVKDILIYLPRSAQIAFLSPFPNQWLREGSTPANSLMRRISAYEMIVIYFALIFLPYAIWHWRRRIEIWVISAFCVYMMLIYGLAVCNIGTLYRMKYVYITTLLALGIAGFMIFLDDLNIKRKIK